MTEEEIAKAVSRFIIENGNRNLTTMDKKLLKQAVDQTQNWYQLLTIMIMARMK